MNKKKACIFLIAVVVIILIYVFALKSNYKTNIKLENILNEVQAGNSIKCNIASTIDKIYRTVYISDKGNKYFSNAYTLDNNKNKVVESNALYLNNFSYLWGTSNEKSFARKSELSSASVDNNLLQFSNPSDDVNIKIVCKLWNIDDAIFNLPKGIEFKQSNTANM